MENGKVSIFLWIIDLNNPFFTNALIWKLTDDSLFHTWTLDDVREIRSSRWAHSHVLWTLGECLGVTCLYLEGTTGVDGRWALFGLGSVCYAPLMILVLCLSGWTAILKCGTAYTLGRWSEQAATLQSWTNGHISAVYNVLYRRINSRPLRKFSNKLPNEGDSVIYIKHVMFTLFPPVF